MRSGIPLERANCTLTDPLLTVYAQMIDLFWTFKRQEGDPEVDRGLAAISDGRLRAAAAEFLQRAHSQDH